MILLELGLWARADQLDKGLLVSEAMASDPAAVKRKLAKHTEVRLAFYAGDRFRSVVIGCLTGSWRERPVVEAFPDMVAELKMIAAEL